MDYNRIPLKERVSAARRCQASSPDAALDKLRRLENYSLSEMLKGYDDYSQWVGENLGINDYYITYGEICNIIYPMFKKAIDEYRSVTCNRVCYPYPCSSDECLSISESVKAVSIPTNVFKNLSVGRNLLAAHIGLYFALRMTVNDYYGALKTILDKDKIKPVTEVCEGLETDKPLAGQLKVMYDNCYNHQKALCDYLSASGYRKYPDNTDEYKSVAEICKELGISRRTARENVFALNDRCLEDAEALCNLMVYPFYMIDKLRQEGSLKGFDRSDPAAALSRFRQRRKP